jgi:hypothetical protein
MLSEFALNPGAVFREAIRARKCEVNSSGIQQRNECGAQRWLSKQVLVSSRKVALCCGHVSTGFANRAPVGVMGGADEALRGQFSAQRKTRSQERCKPSGFDVNAILLD